MYSKFNLKLDSEFEVKLTEYLDAGKALYNKFEPDARKSLEKFIYTNGHINGTAMKENWFQMEDVDVFISHAHQDTDNVKAFAGWLHEEFGLTSFIDSCVWGYCNDLLKEMDNEYCKNEDTPTYDYNKRNYTTSHVHTMLSCALTEMIDRTECIMFYNSPESIILKEELKNTVESKTGSPWIYYELAMTSLVKYTEPDRFKMKERHFAHKELLAESIEVEYDVEKYLKDMSLISSKDLAEWHNQKQRFQGAHSLDILYDYIIKRDQDKI